MSTAQVGISCANFLLGLSDEEFWSFFEEYLKLLSNFYKDFEDFIKQHPARYNESDGITWIHLDLAKVFQDFIGGYPYESIMEFVSHVLKMWGCEEPIQSIDQLPLEVLFMVLAPLIKPYKGDKNSPPYAFLIIRHYKALKNHNLINLVPGDEMFSDLLIGQSRLEQVYSQINQSDELLNRLKGIIQKKFRYARA